MKIRLKMLKRWGESPEGAVVAFDESKGRRVIAAGFAIEVPEPKPPKVEREIVTPESRGPVVETAVAPGAAEAAVVTPQIGPKPKGKAKKDETD